MRGRAAVVVSLAVGPWIRLLLGTLLMCAVSSSCRTSSGGDREEDDPRGGGKEVPLPAAAALHGKASPMVREANFELRMLLRGEYRVGVAGQVAIVLTAHDGYKVNEEYPFKFRLGRSEGLTFPEPVVKRDRVKLGKQQATMTVPVVPKSPGEQTVAGEFAFSVCTEQKCLIEKRALALTVRVGS